MAWIKAFLTFCIILCVVFLGAVMTFNNAEPVKLDLLVWQSPQLALGIMLVVVLLLGLLLGFAMNTLWGWRLMQQKSRLQKQLDEALKRFEQIQ